MFFVTIPLLGFFVIFAHGSYLPGTSGKLLPWSPPPDSGPNSCWTASNDTIPNPNSYHPGTCRICVIQDGIGPQSFYQVWARDAKNSNMGNTSVIELGPKTDTGSSYAFDVGPKLLTMLVIPNESHSKASQVSMTWGDESAPQMSFDPTTHENSTSCNIFQDSEEVAVTYSQCSFVCGPMAISESGKTSQAIPQQPSKGKPKRSVAHPSPLPAEKDGVLSNGTAFNPNPNNNANATRSPQSCWTTPAKPALHTKKGDFSSGQCQICVTRWDTGEDPKYQLWIRDAHNHAMGEMKTTPLPRSDLEPYDSTNLTTPAGNKFVSLWEMEFDGFFGQPDITGVYMTWQANLEVLQATMTFSPSSVGSPTENCSFSGSTKGGTVTNFQCHFEC